MTLTERILENLRNELSFMANIVRLLIEVEKTKYFAEVGYSSLLNYCQKELGLSRSNSLKRINAARLAERFPIILERLEKNEIHLGALVLLSRHLTEDNHLELLDEARGISEDQLKHKIASRFPINDKPKAKVRWLNEEEALVSVVLSAKALHLLERVKQLRKHAHPDGNPSALIEEALSAYVQKIDPMLQSKAPKERKSRQPHVHPRRIRHRIRHQVWHRDRGQCTYVSPSGHRCTERGGLEVDHRQAWAHGGSSLDIENLRLLCSTHNKFIAEQRFGPRGASG